MIYKIQHGDREISVIAGNKAVAEQFVKAHYGEPSVAPLQQPEPEEIDEDIVDEPELDMSEDASNQD